MHVHACTSPDGCRLLSDPIIYRHAPALAGVGYCHKSPYIDRSLSAVGTSTGRKLHKY